jgi:Na+-driven multidrug efflux pump
MKIMKFLQVIFLSISLIGLSFSQVSAWFFDSFISDWAPDIRYCDDWECGLTEWIEIIKGSLDDIETERSASQYIQDVVQYLLMFISIVAVIYIMYAGFQILIWNGDEEKLKKSRQTIIYVMIGIIVIWLAWPITDFILNMLDVNSTTVSTTLTS